MLSGHLSAMCDRSMIRRAVTNLLSNTIRYAPDGANIDIHLETVAHDAIVRVSNPSRPYSEQEIEHLFGRFVRDEDDDQIRSDGLGLGLAIVQSIMQMHAGTAVAQPIRGGLMFELRWPSSLDGTQVYGGAVN